MTRESETDLRAAYDRGLRILEDWIGPLDDTARQVTSAGPLSFARGAPLRGLLDRGTDAGTVRASADDVRFANSVELVTSSCGDRWREWLLGGHLDRKQIGSLSRVRPDRRRYEVAAVAAGRPLGTKSPIGPPVFDTYWPEVPSRIARAGGLILRAADLSPGGPDEATLTWLGRCRERAAALKEMLLALLDERTASPPSPPSPAPSAGPPAAGLPSALALLEKNIRDLPRLVRDDGVEREHAAAAVTRLTAVERGLGDVPIGAAGPSPAGSGDRRVLAVRNPDVDTLVACWLADRCLFAGEPTEIAFVPDPAADPGRRDYVVGGGDTGGRPARSPSGLVLEEIVAAGRTDNRLGGLAELVARGAVEPPDGAIGLRMAVEAVRTGSTDEMLYAVAREWLDGQAPPR